MVPSSSKNQNACVENLVLGYDGSAGKAARSDDLSLIPRTHMEGENWLLQVVL